ncbi:hypothetical protein H6G33_31195 [Calothrix sp. FACHB-1219]|uniref:hypothetical protein n=1 Tax=unclassified Calothrix TaxID=2619626 RepID=UPI00168450FD|nr:MULTISPECIES: hypothetical protein [unclassified Calothrix]MBD2206942.1 hypothetical protein [Calothrix sp. FACHB-168]MBD2221440.1 hypothetical protein [Calothrix sp. FACHB-1219]
MPFLVPPNRNRLLELEQKLLKSQKAAEQENQNKQAKLNEHSHHLPTKTNYAALVPVKSTAEISYRQLAHKLQENRPVTSSLPISSPPNLANFQDKPSIPEIMPVNFLNSNTVDTLSLLDELNPELELPIITSSVAEAIVSPPVIQPKSDLSSKDNQNISYFQLAQQLQAARLAAQTPPQSPDREENSPQSDTIILEASEVTAIVPWIPNKVTTDENIAL